MDEKLKFVARLLDGEKMSHLCAEFGISRKTGYKIYERYKDSGLEGLTDRSRRPCRYANQLPFQIEKAILQIKQEKPSWGTPKIREKLIRQYPDIRPKVPYFPDKRAETYSMSIKYSLNARWIYPSCV